KEVFQELDKVAGPPATATDWAVFRGDTARRSLAAGGLPVLDRPVWSRANILDKGDPDDLPERGSATKLWIDRALAARTGTPLLPGFAPLAVGDRLVYRTYHSVTAVPIRDLKDPQGRIETRA